MNQQLLEVVNEYRKKQKRQWFFAMLSISGLCLLSCIAITTQCLVTYYQSMQCKHRVESDIKALYKQWGIQQRKMRYLKRLLKQEELFKTHEVELLLKTIAQVIPSNTLLTSIKIEKQNIAIEGFSKTQEELKSFVSNLSQKLQIPFKIKQTIEESFIQFTIHS